MRFTKKEIEVFGNVDPIIVLWCIVKNCDKFELDERGRYIMPDTYIIEKVGINVSYQGQAIRKLVHSGFLKEHGEYHKKIPVDGQEWERQVGHLFKLTDKWKTLPSFKDLIK